MNRSHKGRTKFDSRIYNAPTEHNLKNYYRRHRNDHLDLREERKLHQKRQVKEFAKSMQANRCGKLLASLFPSQASSSQEPSSERKSEVERDAGRGSRKKDKQDKRLKRDGRDE